MSAIVPKVDSDNQKKKRKKEEKLKGEKKRG